MALLVSGPALGWWWLIPLGLALGAFYVGDRVRDGSRRPERWIAVTWCVSQLMIAVSVALTGGPESPAIPWFALPAVTLGSRFGNRGVIAGLAYTTTLLAMSTIAVDPSGASAAPLPIIFAFALTLLGGALVQSDRDHRREAVLDPLTGMLNRSALTQRFIELAPSPSATAPTPALGILIGDLDHFKRVNDEHGHATGDAVLKGGGLHAAPAPPGARPGLPRGWRGVRGGASGR